MTTIRHAAALIGCAAIKAQYPETVFHGTDVGRQYDSTGARFLKYPEANGGADSERYRLAERNIAQGERCYRT